MDNLRITQFKKVTASLLTLIFSVSQVLIFSPTKVLAESIFSLPSPRAIITPTPVNIPATMKGIRIFPDNPLRFDFIIDTGHSNLTKDALKTESTKLIKYFLATLTVPEDDLWVNLSPYEKDRIISDKFGVTEMGRDLLAQDYVLKQLTASLIYPEEDLGKKFWDKVYAKVNQLYGTTNLPVNTFNKVWIVPDKTVVYESGDTAFIVASHLKVMLEGDYRALKENMSNEKLGIDKLDKDDIQKLNDVSSAIIKEIVLPEIEKEVNTGENFTSLRQVYNSMILATWFKRNLKESFLSKVYVGENKIAGVDVEDKGIKEKIYQQYLEAFRKGVYNYIKEVYDPTTQEMIPRKYFSGGMEFRAEAVDKALWVEQLTEQDTVEEVSRTTDGRLQTVSAVLDPVKNLNRLLEILKGIAGNEANTLAPNAQEDEILEFIVAYLKSRESAPGNFVREETDQDGNRIYRMNGHLKTTEIGKLIRNEVMNVRGGVKAVNFKGTDGIWKIVGFENEIDQQLDLEREEIKERKQGKHWIVAFNDARKKIRGEDGSINLQSAQEQYEVARNDVMSASIADFFRKKKMSGEEASAKVVNVESAGFDERSAIPLDIYIPYRKLFRASGNPEQDVLGVLNDPRRMRQTVETAFGSLEPARLKDLITRQAAVEQSILELVSNASDAITGRSAPIGRFGMGALQMLAFVIDDDNLALNEGAHIVVETATRSGGGRQLTFFKGKDGRLYFTAPQQIEKKKQGTSVHIKFPQGIPDEMKSLIQNHLRNRLRLFTKMRILMNNEELLNPLDGFYYLNGGSIGYENEKAKINISLTDNEILVEDLGSGMSDDVLLNKYLIPRLGENEAEPTLSSEEIDEQVHLFYKPPVQSQESVKSRIVFQVSGIAIQEAEVEGFDLPPKLVIQLPSSTMLTVSRDGIEIDESTHLAVKALAKKITGRSARPEHQVALINGLMQAVKVLDERNGRVDVYRSLVDTAKEVLIPYLMKEDRLMLPNKPEYHELEFPKGTLFIDEELIYKITPELIPGAQRLSEFEPGTFRKAFVGSFKDGVKTTYLPLGPYLLINQILYEKYKTMPFLLNLRLNFYAGYGRKPLEKGRILSPKQFEGRKDLQAGLLFEKHPVLMDVVPSEQAQWLSGYVMKHPEDGERIQRLLENLEVFLKVIPESLRSHMAWGDILPFSSARTTALKRILNTSMEFISPDTEFLIANGNYFLNREHPERIQRYITNLFLPDGARQYAGHAVFLHVLSQVNNKALNYLDEEVLDTIAQVFEGANLEGYEDAFSAINKGLPFVSGDGVKRLILRWLRIYKNDPQAATSFMNKMGRHYRREAPVEGEQFSAAHKLVAVDKIPDSFTQSFSSVGREWGGGYFTTGLKRNDGRSVVVVLTASALAVRFFAFDNRTGQTEPIGAYDTDTSYVPNSIAWTGAVDGDGRHIFLSTDRYHTSVFAFDIETGEKEKIFVFEHEDHNNLDVSFMKPVLWREPGKFYFLLRTGYKVHMASLDIEKKEIEVLDSIKRQDWVVSTEEDGVGEDGNPIFSFNTEYEYGAYAFDFLARKFKMIHEYDKRRDIGRIEVYPLTSKPQLYLSVRSARDLYH